MIRAQGLQRIVDAAELAFAGADMSGPAKVALSKVFERLQTVMPAAPPSGEDLPVLSVLPQAVANLLPRQDSLSTLGQAVQDFAPSLAQALKGLGSGEVVEREVQSNVRCSEDGYEGSLFW
jgi:hypothetical protein